MSTARPFIRLGAEDDVVVARVALRAGERLDGEDVVVAVDVPRGHKIAVRPVPEGQPLRKLGQVIGFATCNIAPGDHVHTHNCAFADPDVTYEAASRAQTADMIPDADRATFRGYRRASGAVGTRNYIGVLTTVNCAATVARQACMRLEASGVLDDFRGVDGVVPVIHTTGCGLAADGTGLEILQRTLAGYARHPNFAAVLLVGLGCEVNQAGDLLSQQELEVGGRLQSLTIQANRGTRQTMQAIVERVTDLLPEANACRRESIPAAELKLALQCGASDGYSAITANPVLGAAADLLVRHGGTAILSETPEVHGSEQLLAGRAADAAVGRQLLALMDWWREYVAAHGSTFDSNPTPGNLDGGITTILEKSLGATAKGGTTNLMGVYRYAEPIAARGLVFMDSPGFDPCSVTGQVASGANVVCFTTGRGSVFGNRPCPTIKIATSTALYTDLSDDMDFNAGPVADGEASVTGLGEQLFATILEVASGAKTKSEELGFGNDEFVPWQLGAVM